MNIETILAGGFVGAILQQVFAIFNSHYSFKREKAKVLYQNKLEKGEKLINAYVAAYYYSRTMVAALTTAKEQFHNPETDFDFKSLEKAYSNAYIKLSDCENKIASEGAAAYLYYSIESESSETDFHDFFNIWHTIGTKVNRLNQLPLIEEGTDQHLFLRHEFESSLDLLIKSLEKYKTAVESTIEQLKLQSKS